MAHSWRRGTTRALVVGGLALSIVTAAAIDAPPDGPPGVALGSSVILAVEQAALLFTAWLAILVVLAQAWQGRLPVEVSGRGLRYADPAALQTSAEETRDTLTRLEQEFEISRRELADQSRPAPSDER